MEDKVFHDFHTIPVWLSLERLQRLTWLFEQPELAYLVNTVVGSI